MNVEQWSHPHQSILYEPTANRFLTRQNQIAATLPWDSYKTFVIRSDALSNNNNRCYRRERLDVCYEMQNFLDLIGNLFALTNDRKFDRCQEFAAQLTRTMERSFSKLNKTSFETSLDVFARQQLDEHLARLLDDTGNKTTIIIDTYTERYNRATIALKEKPNKRLKSLTLRLTELIVRLLNVLSVGENHEYVQQWLKFNENGKLSAIRMIPGYTYVRENFNKFIAFVTFSRGERDAIMLPYDKSRKRFVRSCNVHVATRNASQQPNATLKPILVNDFVESYNHRRNEDNTTTTTVKNDAIEITANAITAELITTNTKNTINEQNATITAIALRRRTEKIQESWYGKQRIDKVRVALRSNLDNDKNYTKVSIKIKTRYLILHKTDKDETQKRENDEVGKKSNNSTDIGLEHLLYEIYREFKRNVDTNIDPKFQIKFNFEKKQNQEKITKSPIEDSSDKKFQINEMNRSTTNESRPMEYQSAEMIDPSSVSSKESRSIATYKSTATSSASRNTEDTMKQSPLAESTTIVSSATTKPSSIEPNTSHRTTIFIEKLKSTLTVVQKLISMERYYVNETNEEFCRLNNRIEFTVQLVSMYTEELNKLSPTVENNTTRKRVIRDINNTLQTILDDIVQISEQLLLNDRYETYRQLCVLMKEVTKSYDRC